MILVQLSRFPGGTMASLKSGHRLPEMQAMEASHRGVSSILQGVAGQRSNKDLQQWTSLRLHCNTASNSGTKAYPAAVKAPDSSRSVDVGLLNPERAVLLRLQLPNAVSLIIAVHALHLPRGHGAVSSNDALLLIFVPRRLLCCQAS